MRINKAIFCIVFSISSILMGELKSQNVLNSTDNISFYTIQEAIDAPTTDNGDEIKVGDGTYNENLNITKDLYIHSVNGKSTTFINGSSASAVIVSSDGVTLEGFTISNPTGYYGININNHSNILVKSNLIQNIGSPSLSGQPVYGIVVSGTSNAVSNIAILENTITALDGGQGASVGGIAVGFSSNNFDITGLNIESNIISDIDANTSPFASFPNGGRGAYGIIMNLGSGSGTGKIISPILSSNEISDLEGLWAHGIGLEGDTPGAYVSNNVISGLTDHKMPTDAVGIMIEDNPILTGVTITNNSITSAIAINNTTGNSVLAECNWFGSAVSGDLPAKVLGNVDYTPWLASGGDGAGLGFQPLGSCNGTPVVIASAVADPIICGETMGSIEVTFSGGSSPYTISWNGPSSGGPVAAISAQTIGSLAEGSYDITVTDNNGSTATGSATVEYLPVRNVTDNTNFATIQEAIDAVNTGTGDVIQVCAGTYMESVVINKSIHLQGQNVNTTFIMAPASIPVASDPESFIVKASGPTVSAEISGLTIKGPGPGGCGTIAYGILVRDGANANIHDNKIIDIRDNPFSGCQNGIGIQVGRQALSTTGTATITNNTIQGYQKNGITVDGLGSSATINGNIITGAGNTPIIAQNGLQVSRGATASVMGNTISGNSFHLMGNPSDWGSTGILLFQSGQVTLSGGNNLSGNDQNYYAYQPTGTLSLGAEIFGSSTAPIGFGNQIVNVSTQNLDLRASTFGGTLPSAMTMTQLFDLEDFILQKIDSENYGFVYVKTNNTFVTPLSFETGSAQIQRGIDAASDGFTVNVRSGNYAKQIAPNKSIFGVGSYQFGLSVDKNNLTLRGYKAGDVPVGSASEAAVSFTTGATNNFGASGIFVQGNGVTIEGLKVGNNLNASDVKDNNKTFEIIGDAFTMTKNWITPDSDEGTIYMGRWDASHPISTYSISNNKLENTLISINNGVGIGGLATRLIQNNEFTGTATPYLIGFRGWNGPGPVQGWIVYPVGGATVTGNNFATTGVVNYIQARGNAGGYEDIELDWSAIWTMNTFGNHVITLQNEGAFDPRTYDAGGYTDTRRITPFIQENVNIGGDGDVVLASAGTFNETLTINNEVNLKGAGISSTILAAVTSCIGTGVLVNVDNVGVQNLTIQNYMDGIVTAGVEGLTINNVKIVEYCRYGFLIAGSLNSNLEILNSEISRSSLLPSTIGIRAGTSTGVEGLLIDQSIISGNTQGISVFQSPSPVPFNNINITNSVISNNSIKGMYFEKLSNAIFDGLTMSNNGTDNAYAFNTGIDINLKHDNYSNITIKNSEFSNSGFMGTASDPESPVVIGIKARDDAPSYNGIPATLSGVQLLNNKISGPQNGIRFGEFGKVNAGPSNVIIQNNDLSFAFANKAVISRINSDISLECNWHGSTDLNTITNNFTKAGSGNINLGQILAAGGDASVNIGFQPASVCICPNGNLVTNTNTSETFCSIQAAIDDAQTLNGHVITVGAGTYVENILVNKQLEIYGAGATTIVVPATSNPNTGGGSLGGTNVFLIQANNVTIHDLVIDGDNTSLTSAENFGGANIDARNGIITNHAAGVFNNLTVHHVTVKNIYLRGMYASSGGSFNFHDNTVQNVQASTSSIAMFNFGGTGSFTNNIVSDANDAISSNHSTGTVYSGNIVTNSGSGIHTDNNGDGGGTADLIQNNQISNSPVNGYGIFVFAPYLPVTVSDNTITNVEVGLTSTGSYVNVSPVFTRNTVDAVLKANSIGIYSTTEIWGYASGIQKAIFTNNFINNNARGFMLGSEAGFTNSTTANENSITGSTLGVKLVQDYTEVPPTGNFALDMNCNWWGSSSPSAVVLAVGVPNPPVTFLPFMVDGTDNDLLTNGFQAVPNSCTGTGPVKLYTDNTLGTLINSYFTIQAAVDAASNGNAIVVDAGTYAENIIVDKSVSILGPNSAIDPCSMVARVGEAIVVPATAAIATGEIFHVAASNVTISGFTIDGDNTAISSGYSSTNGADIDAAEGVTVYETGVNTLTVTNNIIKNLSYFAVTLYDYPAGVPSSGHVISKNKIEDLGTYDVTSGIELWGGGVLLYNNQYAAVTNNCMTNVRIGIQTGNFYGANPGLAASQVISGNTMSVRKRGIFHNLAYGAASAYTISGNSITGVMNANETAWDGILLSSLSVPSVSSNNSINGTGIVNPSEGYELWNVKSTSPAVITGGSVSNVSTGLFVNNYDGYPSTGSNAPDGAHASVSTMSISPNASGTGIYVKDNSLSAHANVQLAIGAGVTVMGGTTGLRMENASASIVGGTLNNLVFTMQTGNYIELINNIGNLDGTSVMFNGQTGASATLTENFAIEDKITHKIDDGALGYVSVKANHDFVTTNSFIAPSTTTAQIQRGIDAASDGFTVNVREGNYAKQIAPNKSIFGVGSYQFGLSIDKNNLTLKGYKAGDVPVVSAMEAAVSFTTGATNNFGASGIFVQGNGVTIEGLKVGNNLNASDVKDNNKTFEIIGDAFTMIKNWITPDSDEGTIYMGRWDDSHPISTYSISNNKLENTLVSINNGVGIGGPATRLIQNNEFTGTATPYLIGFRGWNGPGPVQGWIVYPVGGATVTGNNFATTGVVNYIQARGNAGGYEDSELDWSAIWTMNTFGNHVITLQNEGAFDPRTYDAGGYTASRRITPFIQENINIGVTGDTTLVGPGTYPESVTIATNGLSLKGVGVDKTQVVINGTGLTGPINGITLNSGITGTAISNLTIKNFTGGGGNNNAGIYGVLQNSMTSITNVAVQDNPNASGIYLNGLGGINNVSITNSMVSGHTPGARGITIWNGFKQNIAITNNMVTNNNCCGIELQDGTGSAVNISGNTIDIGIGDNAIAALGLNQNTGLNTINNNIITGGGRFGLEIKNPNGGVTVSGNNVSLTTQNADLRDRAGIAIIRRDFTPGNPDGYADIPNGVTVTGNTVTGYQQTSGEEGFGIVVEGTGHIVAGNTLTGNEVGIQLQGGGHAVPNYVENNAGSGDQAVGQSPNYFGRGNAPFVCNISLGTNTFSTNGTDVRLVTANETSTNEAYIVSKVQGSIYNMTQNTYHCTIQDAIDNSNGTIGVRDVIIVPSGIYKEELVVTKNHFELHGANFGKSGCDTRDPESVIMAPRSDPDPNSATGVSLFYLDSNRANIVIDGFTFEGDNPDLTSVVNFGGANIDAFEAISAYSGVTDVIVRNNIIQNLNYGGIDFYNYYNSGAATGGNLITLNSFKNIQPANNGFGALIYNNAYTDITLNCMTNVNIGVQTGNFSNAKPGGGVNTISNNTIASNKIGIWHNLAYGAAQKFEIKGNTLTSSNILTNNGIKVTSISGNVEVVVENNKIGASNEGIEIWNCPTSVPVLISGDSISNAETGIFINNFEGYNSDGGNVNAKVSGVTIEGAGTNGIRVYDSPLNLNLTALNVVISDSTKVTGYINGILSQGVDVKILIPTGSAVIVEE